MLSDELLARLKDTNRPNGGSNFSAMMDAAKVLGIVAVEAVGYKTILQYDAVIDALDKDYPDWHGYTVPEMEGKSHAQ